MKNMNNTLRDKPPKEIKPKKFKLKCPRCKTKYKNTDKYQKDEIVYPSFFWSTGHQIAFVCNVCGRRLDYKVHKDKDKD